VNAQVTRGQPHIEQVIPRPVTLPPAQTTDLPLYPLYLNQLQIDTEPEVYQSKENKMHHQYRLPYPPPDITPTPTSSSSRPHTILPQQDPPDSHSPFLIISIFALRLANQLIHSLVPYPEQVHDTTWLTTFLAPYAAHHALAKIAGQRQEDYESRYQKIVARMKRQPQYPVCFMRLNPDRRDDGQRGGEMCDGELNLRTTLFHYCISFFSSPFLLFPVFYSIQPKPSQAKLHYAKLCPQSNV